MGFLRKIIKFCAMRTVELTFVAVLLLIMPSLPPFGEYTAFKVTPSSPLTGELAINHRLENAEILFKDKVRGPETFADYNGELYVSIHGGQVAKIKNDKLIPVVSFQTEKCEGYYTEAECGRPLGLSFDKHGNLFVADSYSGIWQVDVKTGKKTLVISIDEEIEARKSRIPNSISIADNGDIYWTDSTSEYALNDIIYSLLADGTGRLFRYSASTRKNEVLIDKLHFANGVHLSENEDFVIVCDLMKSRILRYYLKGPKKGQQDVFLDGLPGLPDNISSNKRGGFFIGLVVTIDSEHPLLFQSISQFPLIRKFIARFFGLLDFGFQTLNDIYPTYFGKLATYYIGNVLPVSLLSPKRVTVLEVNNDGKVINSYHSVDRSISSICEAHIFEEYLYLGSPYNYYIARVKLADIGLSPIPAKITPKKSTPTTTQKPTTTTEKPTTTTQKPTTTTQKPTTTTEKPTTTTRKTATTTQKPTTTTQKPPTTTQEPPTSTQKPTTTTQKPTTTTEKPTTTTSAPKPTAKPATTTPKPTEAPKNKEAPVNDAKAEQSKEVPKTGSVPINDPKVKPSGK